VSIDLLIATLRIRLEAAENFELAPGERFSAFICLTEGIADVVLHVYGSSGSIPVNSIKVFDAPLMEESSFGPGFSGIPFWSVWRDEECIFVKVALPGGDEEPLLVMNRDSNKWDLFMDTKEKIIDPLPYPLDGLIIYYLTLKKQAIMIHASAVNTEGRGWLFSGSSGNGKTTIAKLFDNYGIEVVHDDRLVLLRDNGEWFIHSTPVYRNDVPRCVKLDHIWLLEHGESNISTPLRGATATALVLANCIQQNWDKESIATLLSAVDALTSSVPVSRLRFVPDNDVCKYLLLRTESIMAMTLEAGLTMLNEGHSITITAGGESMWPSIRRGDNVIIEPFNKEQIPVKGDIVALIRDGGLVVHRVVALAGEDINKCYQTRGDSSLYADPWSGEEEIAGVVREIARNGKRNKISSRVMPYIFNHFLSAIAGAVNRL
jgi:signal peptidase I